MAKKKSIMSPDELTENALVPESEWPYEVPGNWVWTNLGTLSSIKGGKRLPKGHHLVDEKTSHPYIRVMNFYDNSVDNSGIKYIAKETYDQIKNYIIKREDIYISIAGTIGKVGIIPMTLDGGNLTENAAKITKIRGLYQKYLLWLLNSEGLQRQIAAATIATTQAKLALFRIKALKIPLPPLSEQQRIVDRIESLFEKLDQAKGHIQDVIDSYENRKSAILHKAFTGELTKKWREENGIGMDSWEEKKLGELLNPMVTKKPDSDKEFFRYIDIDAIDNTKQKVRKPKNILVSSAPSRASRKVEKDSILFSMVRPYLKNIAYITEDLENCIASTGFYVCMCKKSLYSKFLFFFLCKQETTNIITSYMKGDNSPSIRKRDFENIALNLPGFKEQTKIVSIVEELMTREQQALDLYNLIEEIDLMKKSILARAFRGELGTNDPTEESSMELIKEVLGFTKEDVHQ